MCGKTDGLLHLTKMTVILLSVIDPHGFAIGHDPAGNAFYRAGQ